MATLTELMHGLPRPSELFGVEGGRVVAGVRQTPSGCQPYRVEGVGTRYAREVPVEGLRLTGERDATAWLRGQRLRVVETGGAD